MSAVPKITALRGGGVSLAAAADAFLTTARAANPNTHRAYASSIDRTIERLGRDRALADVTHDRLVSLCGTVELDGQLHTSELTPDHVMFAADGAELGPVADLVRHTFDGLNLRSAVAAAQDGDQYLVIDVTRPRLPQPASEPIEVYLQRESHPPHLLPLRGLRIICASRVDVRPVQLAAGELQGAGFQGAAFAYGSGQVAGVDALVVFTHDSGREHLSVRFTDATGATTDWSADPESQELVPHTSGYDEHRNESPASSRVN